MPGSTSSSSRIWRANTARSTGGLHDEGLRVLADDQIAYEADAILLVECDGDKRFVTPIIKPPRPAHLLLGKRYPASLAALYPEQAPESDAKPRRKAATVVATPEETTEATPPATLEPAAVPAPPTPPRNAAEAEQRFYACYAGVIGGTTWSDVQRYLQSRALRPTTVEGWIAVAEAVRERARAEGVSVMSA